MQSLIDRLQAFEAKLGSQPKRRKRRSRKGASTQAVAEPSVQQQALPGSSRKRKRKRGKRCAQPGEGEVVMRRVELLREFKSTSNATSTNDYVDLVPGNLQLLKTLWKVFERIKWVRCHVMWKPAVAATYGGTVSYGADWSLALTDVTKAQVVACTPHLHHQLFRDSSSNPLVLPSARLMSRQWYVDSANDVADKAPARVIVQMEYAAAAAVVPLGELWVDYEVVLSGTRA